MTKKLTRMRTRLMIIMILFIANRSSAQSVIWAKAFGGHGPNGFDQGVNVTVDAVGNVYMCGDLLGSGNYDPGGSLILNSAGSADVLIAKFDAQGDMKWGKKVGGTGSDRAKTIAVDDFGNIYVAGNFNSNGVDFDPGPGSSPPYGGISNMSFLLKLDSTGSFVWSKVWSKVGMNNSKYFVEDISVKGNGIIYLTGHYENIVDLDPGPDTILFSSPQNENAFILKLDATGNYIWAQSFGGSFDDVSSAIFVNSQEEIFITGHFRGTADFDPGSGVYNLTSSATDAFIAKLDSSGGLIWVKQSTTSGGIIVEGLTKGRDILEDDSGNVIVAGSLYGICDINPGTGITTITSGSLESGFVLKLDESGNYIWSYLQDTSYSTGWYISLAKDRFNDIFCLGRYFYPDAGGSLSLQAGIQKLSASGNDQGENRLHGSFANILSLCTDTFSNMYVTGCFRGQLTSDDPSLYLPSYGILPNILLAKFSLQPFLNTPVTGIEDVCEGDIVLFSIPNIWSSIGYTWTVPPGSFILSGQGTNVIDVMMGSSGGSVTVTPYNSYGNGNIKTFAVDSDPIPLVTSHPSDQIVAAGAPASFSIATSIVSGTRKWEVSIDSINYAPITLPGYSGMLSETLMISQAHLSHHGYRFRCITRNGTCRDTSNFASLEVHTLSSDPAGIDIHTLYPNPATEMLKISGAGDGAHFKIMDMHGRVVMIGMLNASKSINVLGLLPGMYFFQVGDDSPSIKFIRE